MVRGMMYKHKNLGVLIQHLIQENFKAREKIFKKKDLKVFAHIRIT